MTPGIQCPSATGQAALALRDAAANADKAGLA